MMDFRRTYIILWAVLLGCLTGRTEEYKEFDTSGDFRLEKLNKIAGNVTNTNDPYFDPLVPTKLRGYVGKSILLSCVVHNLGNKTVSWIRHRDLHILTVGSYTYTSDERFQSSHHKESEEWTLHIKWVQQKDKGMYECQVSTQPVKSYFVYLDVVGTNYPHGKSHTQSWSTPRQQSPIQKEIYQQMYGDQVLMATISGGPDFHVNKGDSINLSCHVTFGSEPPVYVHWYHRDNLLNGGDSSNANTVSTVTGKDKVTKSSLLVTDVSVHKSGKYTCKPSNAEEASVRVHVVDEATPAAMQSGSENSLHGRKYSLDFIFLSYLYWKIMEYFYLFR